jgi:hypothetical protein
MNRERRLAIVLLCIGLLLAGGAQVLVPGAPPLYDGVVVAEPYLWLSPPPDHPGGALGDTETIQVGPDGSELLAVSTPEISPQAQVFGVPGSLVLPRGASSIDVSIQPVEAPVEQPADGYIDGNVYRFALTDQAGNEVTAKPKAEVTVVLRAADPTLVDATIERFDGTSWQRLDTENGGLASFYTVVETFGDFAVVAAGTSPYGSAAPSLEPAATAEPPPSLAPTTPGPTSTPLGSTGAGDVPAIAMVAIAMLVLILLAIGFVAWRRRPRSPAGRDGWSR